MTRSGGTSSAGNDAPDLLAGWVSLSLIRAGRRVGTAAGASCPLGVRRPVPVRPSVHVNVNVKRSAAVPGCGARLARSGQTPPLGTRRTWGEQSQKPVKVRMSPSTLFLMSPAVVPDVVDSFFFFYLLWALYSIERAGAAYNAMTHVLRGPGTQAVSHPSTTQFSPGIASWHSP